jgi:putative glutathione S-transferase
MVFIRPDLLQHNRPMKMLLFLYLKCNLKRLVDYPNLWDYTHDLYQQPGVAETINMHHIKQHYYGSYTTVNPTDIVPSGSEIDLYKSHNRHTYSE